jgi:hypothetical protein
MTADTESNGSSNALEDPWLGRQTGTEPDEWRLGENTFPLSDTDGFPR